MEQSLQFVGERAEKYIDTIASVNRAVWEYAEEGLKEHRSVACMIRIFEQEGFEIVRDGAGMSLGTKGAVLAAQTIAATAIYALQNPELIRQANEELWKQTRKVLPELGDL